MLLLVVTHGIRPAANKTVQEEIARTAKGLAGLAAIAINEANTRTVLRTGAVHCIAHLLTCDFLDDLLLRLLCNLVGANRQSPVGPDEMAGVAIGISLEIILMLGFGLPEVACRNDFRNDLARPQA
jgi:hypothetical protein